MAATPSPKASLALVERAIDLLSTTVDIEDLAIAAADYERQVSEVVASDDDVVAYVHRLESSTDDDDEPRPTWRLSAATPWPPSSSATSASSAATDAYPLTP